MRAYAGVMVRQSMNRQTRGRGLRRAWLLAMAALVLPLAHPAAAQEGTEEDEELDPADAVRAPGEITSLDIMRSPARDALMRSLARLASDPRNLDALITAGNSALALNDSEAALNFFARAEEVSPASGEVKAGLARALLAGESPFEALVLFDEAVKLGIKPAEIAADRGLARDLTGAHRMAQEDYTLALIANADDETRRRYAFSLGITDGVAAADGVLQPLLEKRDRAAWRTRAFVMALNNDAEGAVAIAVATLPPDKAEAFEPFLRLMPLLTSSQAVAAVQFGHFPKAAAIGKDDPRNSGLAQRLRGQQSADAGLIPVGEPFAPAAAPPPRVADRKPRRRPGREQEAERAELAASASGTSVAAEAGGKDAAALALADTAREVGTPPPAEARKTQPEPTPTLAPAPAPAEAAPNSAAPPPPGASEPGFFSLSPDPAGAVETPPPAPDPKRDPGPQRSGSLAVAQAATPPKETADSGARADAFAAKVGTVLAQTPVQNDSPAASNPSPASTSPASSTGGARPAGPVDSSQPARHWVQVASSANEAGLAGEYRKLRAAAPDVFGDIRGWSTPLNFTNRLLAGPFDSSKAAQDFVNALAAKDIPAFTWTSPEGQEIKRLPTR